MVEEGQGMETVSIVDGEGNFTEQFIETLDEDIRGEPSLKEVGNVKDMAKMYVHAQRKLGRNRVALPPENATDEQLNEFFQAVGKPKTADDYPYTRPEAVPEDLRTADHLKNMRETAFKRHWTLRQWQDYIADEDKRVIDDIATRDINETADTEAAEKRLKEIWGMAYEERINLANRLINETVPEEKGRFSFSREDFVKAFGRNPMMIEWLAEHGKVLTEHEVLIAELTQKAPKEAQAELDEIIASDDYQKYLTGEIERTNPSKHKAMTKKISDLYDVIHSAEKKAG